MKVFISHASTDHALVHVLAGALAEHGIDGLVAGRRMSPGTRLDKKVRDMIEESDCVVVINTPSASRSRWVQQEVGCARALDKHIVPLKTQRAKLAAMLEGLEYYQFKTSEPADHFSVVASHLRKFAIKNGIRVRTMTTVGDDVWENLGQILHLPHSMLCPKCKHVDVHLWVCLLCGDWVCVECGATVPPDSRATWLGRNTRRRSAVRS